MVVNASDVITGDGELGAVEEVSVHADEELAAFRFRRHFMGPVLGRRVVGANEKVGKERDAIGESCAQRWVEARFLGDGDNSGELEDHDNEFHNIDVQLRGVEGRTSGFGPDNVKPELEYVTVSPSGSETRVPDTGKLSIAGNSMAYTHFPRFLEIGHVLVEPRKFVQHRD